MNIRLRATLTAYQATDIGSKIVKDGTGELEIELKPDVFYQFGSGYTKITFTLGTPKTGYVNEYNGEFKTGETVPQIIFPDGISWVGRYSSELDANKTYQFSILNNIGVIVGA